MAIMKYFNIGNSENVLHKFEVMVILVYIFLSYKEIQFEILKKDFLGEYIEH